MTRQRAQPSEGSAFELFVNKKKKKKVDDLCLERSHESQLVVISSNKNKFR